MGREIRRVPKDWQHPKDSSNGDKPLFENYNNAKKDFEETWKTKGLQTALDEWGRAPNTEDYMPEWSEEEMTHIQMYECTSEGTPIGPVMDTPENLARWLVDNNASAFAGQTATYEQWLSTINNGGAVSAMIGPRGIESGVAAMHEMKSK